MKPVLIIPALGLLLATSQAFANDDPDEFYKTKNCLACHRIDRVTLGRRSRAWRPSTSATRTLS